MNFVFLLLLYKFTTDRASKEDCEDWRSQGGALVPERSPGGQTDFSKFTQVKRQISWFDHAAAAAAVDYCMHTPHA